MSFQDMRFSDLGALGDTLLDIFSLPETSEPLPYLHCRVLAAIGAAELVDTRQLALRLSLPDCIVFNALRDLERLGRVLRVPYMGWTRTEVQL